MNTIEIIGNIGQDATEKMVGEKKCINFSVATTEKSNGQEITSWYSCTKWGETAILPYLKKGTKVFIRGNFSATIYEDKNKEHKISLNVIVRELELLSSPIPTTPNVTPQNNE